ncbi:MAG TPA: GNAT family N-acetyltransferase [Bdellovibrionota bacterium]|nr:GNAT family N-acetyltransferase [Bdellovibrionota bacterium]
MAPSDLDPPAQLMVDSHVDDFLSKALVHLESQEAKNHLALGLALALQRGEMECPDAFYAVVVKERTTFTVALRTPPHFLILTDGDQESVGMICRSLAMRKAELPGVLGPADEAEYFAQEWSRLTGKGTRLAVQHIVFQIDRIRTQRPKHGVFRVAHDADLPLIAEWMQRFGAEATPWEVMDPAKLMAVAKRRIRAHEIHVIEDGGRPVSMAAWAGATTRGVRINFVYTPHENRKKGYAAACVGSLVSQQLAAGREKCFLYADAGNPASVALYLKLGFLEADRPRLYLFQ